MTEATEAIEKWSVSKGEENFSGIHPTKEDAIACGRDNWPGREFWIGRTTAAWPLIDFTAAARELMESLDSRLSDHVAGDGPLIEITKSEEKELANIIEGYLRKHATITNQIVDLECIAPTQETDQ